MSHLTTQKRLIKLAASIIDSIEKTESFFMPIDPYYCKGEVDKLQIMYADTMALLFTNFLNIQNERGILLTSDN